MRDICTDITQWITQYTIELVLHEVIYEILMESGLINWNVLREGEFISIQGNVRKNNNIDNKEKKQQYQQRVFIEYSC